MLGIRNPLDHVTCIGYGKQKPTCGILVAGASRNAAISDLKDIAMAFQRGNQLPNTLLPMLVQIAQLLHCKRWHQDQADTKAHTWFQALSEYRRGVQQQIFVPSSVPDSSPGRITVAHQVPPIQTANSLSPSTRSLLYASDEDLVAELTRRVESRGQMSSSIREIIDAPAVVRPITENTSPITLPHSPPLTTLPAIGYAAPTGRPATVVAPPPFALGRSSVATPPAIVAPPPLTLVSPRASPPAAVVGSQPARHPAPIVNPPPACHPAPPRYLPPPRHPFSVVNHTRARHPAPVLHPASPPFTPSSSPAVSTTTQSPPSFISPSLSPTFTPPLPSNTSTRITPSTPHPTANTSLGSSNECGICLDEIPRNPGVLVWRCDECRNPTHTDCFDGWVASSPEDHVRCIYCRADVVSWGRPQR